MNYYATKHTFFFVLAIFFVANFLFGGTPFVQAETEAEKAARLSRQIEEYQREIDKLKAQSSTLANQIAQFDARIRLTELKITQTEEKIGQLSGRIGQLQTSLSSLTKAFEERALETYKLSRISEPYLVLFSSNNLNTAISSFHYLKRLQEEDRSLMDRLKTARGAYEIEKGEQEVLQDELQGQRNVLGSQKTAKATLLAQTKNDEKRYQQLLAQVRSEYEAIQAIIAGRGQETEVGKVSQGSRIASIIQGPSCNSNGQHLHFIVSRDRSTQNPFSYLRPISDFKNCSGSSCGSGDGDPANMGGSWDWPIATPIELNQGYGSTWAVRNSWVGRIYSFHNGIDIDSHSSPEVRAVQSGTLYRGSYGGANGCRLRYVRVDHDNSDIDTLYLHINY